MKKILSFTATVLLLMSGCGQTFDDHDDAGNMPLTRADPEILGIFQDFLADYAKEYMPQDPVAEIIHKTVFAGIAGRLIDTGTLSTTGIYSGLYHSWRIGSSLTDPYRGNTRASAPMNPATMALLAINPDLDEVIDYGDNFYDSYEYLLETLGEDAFYRMTDSEKMDMVLEEIPGFIGDGGFNKSRVKLQLTAGTNPIALALEYRADLYNRPVEDYFAVADGFEYLRSRYPAKAHIIDVLEVYIPVFLAQQQHADDRWLLQYWPTLLFEDYPVLETVFSADDADLLCKLLAMAGNCAAFWETQLDGITVVNDPEEFDIEFPYEEVPYTAASYNLIINTTYDDTEWEITSKSSFITLNYISGTGSRTIRVTIPANTDSKRHASIKLKYNDRWGNELERTVSFYQLGEPKFKFNVNGAFQIMSGKQKRKYSVNPGGDYYWEIISLPSGVTASQMYGTGSQDVEFSFPAYSGSSYQNLNIVFRIPNEKPGVNYTLMYQRLPYSGKYIQIGDGIPDTEDNVEYINRLDKRGGNYRVRVACNTTWYISSLPAGISLVSVTPDQKGHADIIFYVSPNNTGATRYFDVEVYYQEIVQINPTTANIYKYPANIRISQIAGELQVNPFDDNPPKWEIAD